jgi:phosphoglycerate dehydrogenase-like enzyme
MRNVFYNSFGDAFLYAMIREACDGRFEVLTIDHDDEKERLSRLVNADAVIVASRPFTRSLIDGAPALKFVHHQGVGYHDTIDTTALKERNIPLAITPGGTTVGVAEHSLMLMLGILRRFPFADAELRQGRFHINTLRPVSRELRGRTVGLVGMGRIGAAVAARLKPFGVTAIYYDPVGLPKEDEKALGVSRRELESLLGESDIVSLHLPLTADTRHLMTARTFGAMKRGSYLINTSRGGLVDERALTAALNEGRLAGAALDVFETEPPSIDNPLLKMPSVALTPHIAAGTRDAFLEKMGFIFGNLEKFWQGAPVENLVKLGD